MRSKTLIPTPGGYVYGDEDDGSDETWVRQFALCEEDCRSIACVDPRLPRGNSPEFRWYRSPNVVDLVRVRYVRAKKNQPGMNGAAENSTS